MEGEKPYRYEPSQTLPIPTYDEAISRPSSSHSFLGPSEISHDAERQTRSAPQQNGYQPPTVESARSSLDSSGGSSTRGSAAGLQREMEQMEILDLGTDGYPRVTRVYRISKRITSLTHSLSSINLPFSQWLPSRHYIRVGLFGASSSSPELLWSGNTDSKTIGSDATFPAILEGQLDNSLSTIRPFPCRYIDMDNVRLRHFHRARTQHIRREF